MESRRVFAFLQMYIGKQVIEGEIKKVLLVVAFNSALAYFFYVLLYIRKNYQTYLISTMNTELRNDISKKYFMNHLKRMWEQIAESMYPGILMMSEKLKTRASKFFTVIWIQDSDF